MMSSSIGRFTYLTTAVDRARDEALARRAAASDAAGVGIPAAPPADVRDEVDAAAQRAADLAAAGRELHFTHDAVTGRVVVQVRALDGRVLRTIAPSQALAIMSGGS